MSDIDYLNNISIQKELPLLNTLLKNTFVKTENDKVILSKLTDGHNFNEERIRTHALYTSIYSDCTAIFKEKLSKMLVNKTVSIYSHELSCWLTLSDKVLRREAIGFPLIYKHERGKSGINMLFETGKVSTFNSVYNLTFGSRNVIDQIKFQKLLIAYTLFKNNIMYDTLIFDEFTIPETIITFKIQSMYFNIKLNVFVILSCKTSLYYADTSTSLIESKYINDALSYFKESTDYNFIEYFLLNFINFLDLNCIPIYNTILSIDTINIPLTPPKGILVKFLQNKKFNYGILADYFNCTYTIYYITESRPKKNEFLQHIISTREDIFIAENIIPIIKGYIIGKVC